MHCRDPKPSSQHETSHWRGLLAPRNKDYKPFETEPGDHGFYGYCSPGVVREKVTSIKTWLGPGSLSYCISLVTSENQPQVVIPRAGDRQLQKSQVGNRLVLIKKNTTPNTTKDNVKTKTFYNEKMSWQIKITKQVWKKQW